MHGAPDTILLEGRYARSSVSIRARSKDSTREQSTAHGLSHGWRLVAPVQTYAAGGALSILASGLWLAGLILPLGYWSVFAVRGADRRYRPMSAAVTALCATVVVAALVMVSQALGLSALPAWEWAAAAFGAIAGAALGIWRKSVGSRRRTRAPARGEP
jgi:hypothetical protein